MNTHGAVDLAPLKRKAESRLVLARFHDSELEKMARIADELKMGMLEGGWPQLLNCDYPEQGSAIVAKNTYTAMADICNAQKPFIQANTLKPGTILRVTAWGSIGSAAGTATTTMALYLNGAASGTQLAVTAAQTPPTSTVNAWHLEANLTVLTQGASGTIQTLGNVIGINATTTTMVLLPATVPAAAAINTTNNNSITIAATWSVSAAGNTYSVYGFTVEQLN